MLAHVLLWSTVAINKQTVVEYGIRGKTHTARCICDRTILDKCALLTSYKRSAEPW